ncbi:MAG: amidohydrolase family protein [Acidobacteriota bacterium]|nr:amidohydrolase family protein [Acidobacteriota bacterium]
MTCRCQKLAHVVAAFLILVLPAALRAQVVPAADHHMHLQSPRAAQLLNQDATFKPGEQEPPEQPNTAKDMVAALDAAGIRRGTALSDAYRLGSPFVHIPNEAEEVNAENDWTLHQVERYPDRLVGFCSVNPIRPYALAAIDYCYQIGLRGGLKLHLANAKFQFDNPVQIRALRQVFRRANHLRMPILIHLRSAEKWDARQGIQTFMTQILPLAPDVPVQVAHLGGWGGYDRITDESISTFIEECDAQPKLCRHLYFDIAAIVLPPSAATAPPGSDNRLLYDEQKDFTDGPQRLADNLRRIGLGRILFATDWPVEAPEQYAQRLRSNLRLSPAEIDQIFSNLALYFNQNK